MASASTQKSADAFIKVNLQYTHKVSGHTALETVKLHTDLHIGRSDVANLLGIEEPTISKQHVLLHRIVYEQGKSCIPPLVYVRSLSVNASSLIKSDNDKSPTVLHSDSVPILVENGDILTLSPTIYVQITFPGVSHTTIRQSELQQKEFETFADSYTISRLPVGQGTFGAVYMAYKKQCKGIRQVACKIIDLHRVSAIACDETVQEWSGTPLHPHLSANTRWTKIRSKWQQRLIKKLDQSKAELSILRDLSHPNIARIEHVFMSDHTIFIIQELITGGDLWSYLDTFGTPGLADAEITVIIKQLLEAVVYLHDHAIVHRDIKPENILMDSWTPGGRVVLTDFGLAKRASLGQSVEKEDFGRGRMHTAVGTSGYAAPEVQLERGGVAGEQGYTCAVDLWSVGAIAVLLFTSSSMQDMFPIEEVAEVDATCLGEEELSETVAGIAMDSEGYYPYMATLSQRTDVPELSRRRMSDDLDSPNVAGTLICDLSSLDRKGHTTWGHIASAPKEFIKRVLVLNESKRMTAHEALQHRWLAQPLYKDLLEEVYQSAIATWGFQGLTQVQSIPAVSDIPIPLEDETLLRNAIKASKSKFFQ